MLLWPILLLVGPPLAVGLPTQPETIQAHHSHGRPLDYSIEQAKLQESACYPALGFDLPANQSLPTADVSKWWCDSEAEQGFFGFSYDVGACKSLMQMTTDFNRMRTQFSARYVRLYSACDSPGFMDDVVKAAYTAGIGVYSLIWFGFTGGNQWKARRDDIIMTMKTNPLAPYVIRSIDVGSEPLFDFALNPSELATQVLYVKNQTSAYPVMVATSEMQYGYTRQGNAQVVLDSIDAVHANALPFFDQTATTGAQAAPSILNVTKWFVERTQGSKKVIFTQTGWPTNNHVWKANSKLAVASTNSSAEYAETLNTLCEPLKALAGHGGVGWFWQIWDDEDLDGWGMLDTAGNLKFPFSPRIVC
ncbi:hypothetical protein DL93DRAFT_453633 [Clavulina sp. PMI_390]|nr:hypothetical protein DL93DRAFT_453633 [Clavulina sp. PMI_390]